MAHRQQLSIVVVLVMVLSNFFPLIPYFPWIGKNLGQEGPWYVTCGHWYQMRSIRPPSTSPLMDLYRRTYKSSATKSTTSSPLQGSKHQRQQSLKGCKAKSWMCVWALTCHLAGMHLRHSWSCRRQRCQAEALALKEAFENWIRWMVASGWLHEQTCLKAHLLHIFSNIKSQSIQYFCRDIRSMWMNNA